MRIISGIFGFFKIPIQIAILHDNLQIVQYLVEEAKPTKDTIEDLLTQLKENDNKSMTYLREYYRQFSEGKFSNGNITKGNFSQGIF